MTDLRAARIGLISNPASGHNRDRFARIATHIDACQSIRHRTTTSAAQIPEVLADFAAQGVLIDMPRPSDEKPENDVSAQQCEQGVPPPRVGEAGKVAPSGNGPPNGRDIAQQVMVRHPAEVTAVFAERAVVT